MITAIIGRGPNSVEIPILTFQNREDAFLFLEEISKAKLDRKQSGFYLKERYDRTNKTLSFRLFAYENKKEVFIGEEFDYSKLLTSYYGGCGEMYQLQIRDVEFGKSFVGWDLD